MLYLHANATKKKDNFLHHDDLPSGFVFVSFVYLRKSCVEVVEMFSLAFFATLENW